MHCTKQPVRRLALAALAALLLAAAGCTASYNPENALGMGPFNDPFFPKEDETPIIDTNGGAAEELAQRIKDSLPPHSTIYVAPFVNENTQEPDTLFGRIVAQQFAARLAQLGLPVLDASKESLPVQAGKSGPSGPLLDAEGDEIPLDEQAPREARLFGAFAPAENQVYITAQVVDMASNAAVAGVSWTLPSNKNTRELLPALKRDGMAPNVHTRLDGSTSRMEPVDRSDQSGFSPQSSEINILSN
jgi:TolB-like protein